MGSAIWRGPGKFFLGGGSGFWALLGGWAKKVRPPGGERGGEFFISAAFGSKKFQISSKRAKICQSLYFWLYLTKISAKEGTAVNKNFERGGSTFLDVRGG